MFFVFGMLLMLNLTALAFPPLLLLVVPVDYLMYRYLKARATRIQDAHAERRWEARASRWVK